MYLGRKSITRDHQKSITRGHQKSIIRDHQKSIIRGHQKSIIRGHQKSFTDHQKFFISDHQKFIIMDHQKFSSRDHQKFIIRDHQKSISRDYQKFIIMDHQKLMTCVGRICKNEGIGLIPWNNIYTNLPFTSCNTRQEENKKLEFVFHFLLSPKSVQNWIWPGQVWTLKKIKKDTPSCCMFWKWNLFENFDTFSLTFDFLNFSPVKSHFKSQIDIYQLNTVVHQIIEENV